MKKIKLYTLLQQTDRTVAYNIIQNEVVLQEWNQGCEKFCQRLREASWKGTHVNQV